MIQKTTILVAESILLDQEDTKAFKDKARTMAAEACSSTEKVKRLEPQVLELQGALKSNDNLKKEMDELHKDFETFFISLEDLLAFTFEASIGRLVGEANAQAGAARGEAPNSAAAEGVATTEGVATE
ncbi:hypothetical protein ACFX2G_013322 [Malus domestica]